MLFEHLIYFTSSHKNFFLREVRALQQCHVRKYFAQLFLFIFWFLQIFRFWIKFFHIMYNWIDLWRQYTTNSVNSILVKGKYYFIRDRHNLSEYSSFHLFPRNPLLIRQIGYIHSQLKRTNSCNHASDRECQINRVADLEKCTSSFYVSYSLRSAYLRPAIKEGKK